MPTLPPSKNARNEVINDKTAFGDLNPPPASPAEALTGASDHPAMRTTLQLPIHKFLYVLTPEGQTIKVPKTEFSKQNSGETPIPGALGSDAPTAVEIKYNQQLPAELRPKMSEKIASAPNPCPSPEKPILGKTLCYTDRSSFIYPTTPSDPKMNDPSSRNRLLNDIFKIENTKSR
jgi:hypothetical protein